MLEYEKKVMLTQDEYYALVKLMGKLVSVKKQTNYYFDTNDLTMNKNKITCRIREKDGRFKTTIKKHDTENPDYSTEEVLIEKTEFNPRPFYALGLLFQGELITERIVMYKDDSFEIVIDRNTYLGHTDFELEIEYSKEKERRALEILEGVGQILIKQALVATLNEFMDRVGQTQPKSQRFFERKIKEGDKNAGCFK